MSFFPAGFDPRAEVVGFLDLVEIDAPSGPARFLLGMDGVFTDSSGNPWVGSTLIGASDIEWARGGTAPSERLEMTYFQDPDAPDLIAELRASGDAVLRGRAVRFYLQPVAEIAQLYAPASPPLLIATRTAGALTTRAEGATVRALSLDIEGPFAFRKARRSYYVTREDHEALIGEVNPSLSMVPTDTRQEELLFG